MNHFTQALLDTPTANWIAFAALAVSVAALIVSSSRFSFDTRLAGAKKATELRSVLLAIQRNTHEFFRTLDRIETLYPVTKPLLALSRECAITTRQETEKVLKDIDRHVLNKNSAIDLERYTAYVDDLSKRLATTRVEFEKFTVPILPKPPDSPKT